MKKNSFDQGLVYPYSIRKLWRIMKLTSLILILFLMQVSAATYSQSTKLDIRGKNISISEVLKMIESQSDFTFFYKDDLVNLDRKVDVNSSKRTVNQILDEIFPKAGLSYYVSDKLIVVLPDKAKNSVKRAQQSRTITGVVTDADGEPLIGVTVVVKGTTIGITTDLDGKYSLTVPPTGEVLQFSFVGMEQQEIAINGQEVINVVLEEETKGLEEVVVIGYGTKKKSNLTAAVEMVDTKVISNRPVRTVGEMLEGVVPNLNINISSGAPDATPSFNIRGFTGMGSSAQPLILVDGVQQDINLINSNDIESISVLKDAAASAIYGSRAPHGVILIKTKSGKRGQKMQINYSGDFVINEPTYVFDPADSYEWATTINNKAYNSFQGAKFSPETLQGMLDNKNGTGPNNVVLPSGRYGAHWDATNNSVNRADLAFRDFSTNFIHNLNIMGGTEKTSYYMGLGYFEKEGIYDSPVDHSERYSGTIKVNTDLADWLTVKGNMRYTRQEVVRPNYRDSGSSSSTDKNILGNGQLYYFPNVPSINPNGGYHWLSAIPTIKGETGQLNTDKTDLLVSGGFDFKPIKGLSVKGDFSYVDNSVLTKKDTKQLLVLDADDKYYYSGRTARYDEVEEAMSKLLGHTIDLNATYSKKFNKHDVLLMAGFQQEERKYHQLWGSNRDVYTTDVMSLSTTYGEDVKADDVIWHWATRGYFFRASYNYNNKYLFDFNSRYDAASKYAPDSRWAYFPSVSVGYNVALEDFWPLPEVQMFKVTGTWGKLGDQSAGNYLYLPTMGTHAQTPYLLNNTKLPYVTMPGLVSADLTWAKPRTIGFGLEWSAFENRLQGEYRWYQRTVFDQLGPAEKYPEVLGTNPPKSNNAVSETRGWELSLKWRDKAFDINGSPLRYEVRGIVSDYVGYVVEYEDNTSGKRSGTWTPGEKFGILWGYSGQEIITSKDELMEKMLWRGGWNYPGSTHIPDANGDGRINSGDGGYWYSQGDHVNLGYTYPRYKYSITLSAGWKAFDLSVLLDGVGKEVRHSGHALFIGSSVGGYDSHALAMHEDLGYWSLNNTDGFYPRPFLSGGAGIQTTEKYMMNLAHLRIKNVNLSYSVPKRFAKQLRLSYVKLNFSGENLGFIYNKLRLPMDPIQVRNGGNTYPVQRVFSFGVRLGL